MGKSKEQLLDERQRLLAMREYLGVRAIPQDESFDDEIVATAIKKVQPILTEHSSSTGEEIIAAIAADVGIRFEDVRTADDIAQLERKYLVEQKELGFGRLARELADPSVDALLFQRMRAGRSGEGWVAVLNLQQTEARAYWSRSHEIVHRLAEPPQGRLPFYRHRTSASRVESIIDKGASELAFPDSTFGHMVRSSAAGDLTWGLVDGMRNAYAPTSSMQSAHKAFLRFWPHPAFVLRAALNGRLHHSQEDVALRIEVEAASPSARESGIQFFRNMRVPPTSPIAIAYDLSRDIAEVEHLDAWRTSSGYRLPSRRALTVATRRGNFVYGLVSLL
jgi:hypothetical protein